MSFFFLPQKVVHYDKIIAKKRPNISGDYMITEKLDGNYLFADYSTVTGWSKLRSSSCRVLPSLEWIDLSWHIPTPKHNCRFIFEGLLEGENVYVISGTFNRKEYCKHEGLQLVLHDIVFPDEPGLIAFHRWIRLQQLKDTPLVRKAQLLSVSPSADTWRMFFDQVVDAGGEGIVLKHSASPYRMNNTSSACRDQRLMKMKLEVTKDLLCYGITYSEGKKGNPSMNLLLRSATGVETSVVVPKHVDQQRFGEDNSIVLGKVCEVLAMKELPNGQLREPRFRFTRPDKLPTEID